MHRQVGANCTDAKLYFWTIFLFLSKWDLDLPTHFQIIFGFLEFVLTLQSPLASDASKNGNVFFYLKK